MMSRLSAPLSAVLFVAALASLSACTITAQNAECDEAYPCPTGFVCNLEGHCEQGKQACGAGYTECGDFCCALDAGTSDAGDGGDGGGAPCDAGNTTAGCQSASSCLDMCGNQNLALCPCAADDICSAAGVCESADGGCSGVAPSCSSQCTAWNASPGDAGSRQYLGCPPLTTVDVQGTQVCPNTAVVGQFDSATCIPNTGQCRDGSQTCTSGAWGSCDGSEIGPSAEVCNALDDDCNGYTDEGLGSVSCGLGACFTSIPACVAGIPVSAAGCLAIAPTGSGETCNNLDDNCDGYTDNLVGSGNNTLVGTCGSLCMSWNANTGNHPLDPFATCAPSAGQCRIGSYTCTSGVWGACSNEVGPSVELCNALDDDCDGYTDNAPGMFTSNSLTGLVDPLCQAWQGNRCVQGAGQCRSGAETCQTGGSWSVTTAETGPSTELCNDLDDDCDGLTDNAVGGAANSLQSSCDAICATTARCQSGKGQCKPGAETCASGTWGICLGETGPTAETCNSRDDDCDGVTDNKPGNAAYSLTQTCDSACTSWNVTNAPAACRAGLGQCHVGSQTCSASGWGVTCAGEVGPSVETCNNLDDDCDSYTDNASGDFASNTLKQTLHPDCDSWTGNGKNTCVPAKGQCRSESQTCTSGSWGMTIAEVGPTAELCNDLDDDCDGFTDNAVGSQANNTLQNTTCDTLCASTAGCRAATGQCRDGAQTCNSGAWGSCLNETGPTGEVCNNLDDNCDGYTDNAAGVHASNTLTMSCDSACLTWNANPGSHPADPETSCQAATGQCRNGAQNCSNGTWGASCGGETGPSVEVCNNLDDDCDGLTDNAPNVLFGNTLQQSLHPLCDEWAGPDTCEPGVGQCVDATQLCVSGAWSPNTAEIGPSTESCNALDDDCDGFTDNAPHSGSNTLSQICDPLCQGTTGCIANTGQCKSSNETCTSGAWGSCSGEIGPTAELCNGRDDDCDGYTDNAAGTMANNTLTQTCDSLCATWNASSPKDVCQPGVGQCRDGSQTCSASSWGSCTGETGPTAEVCNGLDDDCDGYTDNNPGKQSYSLTTACDWECAAWTGPGKNTCIEGAGRCSAGSVACTTALSGVVASGQNNVTAITTDTAGNVYWVQNATNGLVLESSGGVVSTIASGQNGPAGIAVDSAGNVYWTDSGSGLVMEESGGVISTVSSGDADPGFMTVDSFGNVYWTDQDEGTVMEETGGSVSTIAGAENSPDIMAADNAGNVYWTDLGSNGSIVEYTAGGSIQTLASGQNSPFGLAVDTSRNVYWPAPFAGNVLKYSAGSVSTLASLQKIPWGVAADTNGNVFWANDGNGTITKYSGGTPTTFASGLTNPEGMTVDTQGNVYWIDSGDHKIYGPANVCTGEVGPSAEICNNIDDDCDGYTDNAVGSTVNYSLASCAAPASAPVDMRPTRTAGEPPRSESEAPPLDNPRPTAHRLLEARGPEEDRVDIALRMPALLTCDVSCTGWDGGTAGECPDTDRILR